ncbi:MAG: SPOR domain-containing protein, partial [Tatlockia sp.]|nr:SPOR domain-containing protein [Tatlockia sp.]
MRMQVYSKLALAMGLMVIGSNSFSAQIVYGLPNASNFKSNSSSDFYIQIASFKSKENAVRLKSEVRNKTDYPLILKEKNGIYSVLVGPIRTSSALRATAQQINLKAVAKVKVATKNINHTTINRLPSPITRRNTVETGRVKKTASVINSRTYASADKMKLPNQEHKADARHYSGR